MRTGRSGAGIMVPAGGSRGTAIASASAAAAPTGAGIRNSALSLPLQPPSLFLLMFILFSFFNPPQPS